MPFKSIMAHLVNSSPGATGAIFVDWEGEAVDQYTVNEDIYHLKVVGAHKGVILNLIDEARNAGKDEEIETVTVRMERYDVLMAPVIDGYFVAITLKRGAPLSRARFEIKKAAQALKKEM